MADNALIIFTRLPIGSETKSRLAPVLSESERAALHLTMWRCVFKSVLEFNNCDVYLYWTGSGDIADYKQHIPTSFMLRRQCELEDKCENLGGRMREAFNEVFALNKYSRVCLIGCDIPGLKPENLIHAFNMLNNNDAVIAPTFDGGYWLIGFKSLNQKFIDKAFDEPVCAWGNSDVLSWTLEHIKSLGLSCACLDNNILLDIDTPEDLERFNKLFIKAL